MKRFVRRLTSDERGATAIEYGLIASLIAMVLLGAWAGTGNSLSERFNNIAEHVKNYGHGIEDRLTGAHETAPWTEYSYGVSNRGASVRIPWQVAVDKKGYIEDRRPNANMDPYVVTRLITDTVCSQAL